jgi:16S rRNA G966 N2-methylase RsmD
MAKKPASDSKKVAVGGKPFDIAQGRPSAIVDTRVIYCGDNLEQLKKFPDECIDLIYIDPPFNSNRNYEVFWGETKEKRASSAAALLHRSQRGAYPSRAGS